MKRCPGRDRLAAYLADLLDLSVREALEEHVEACAACQGMLDELTARRGWGLASRSEADAGVTGEQTIFLRRLQQAPPGIMEPVARWGDRDVTARGGPDLRGTNPGSLAAAGVAAERGAPVVPNYEVFGEQGRGGMGVVYRARQVPLNRPCALKMILAGAHATPEAIARFLAEAQTIARLQHPHIVQIHHIGEADGLPFFELEYLPSGSLNQQFDGTPWPPQRAAHLVEQLAGAIAEAHRLGVVHRDLKPANVLLADDGTPKIADFGLAKMLDSESGLTQSDLILGSPSYMAPEQAEGRSQKVGPAADIYALGAILYELLVGRPPFRGATVLETLDQVKGSEPVPPSRLVPKLPRDLETIALKCLHKESARRYADAASLAEDLRRFLANEPIRARRVSAAERSWRWCQRNPVVAGLMAAVFVLLATLAGVASVGYVQTNRALNGESKQRELAEEAEAKAKGEANRARAAEQEVRRQWYAASINLMQPAWDTGQVGRLHAKLAETEAYPERGFEWYYLQRLCHLEQHTLVGHRDVVNSVAWSPDGTRLATGSRDGTAKVWEAASGQERLTLRGHAGPVYSVSWSPDGTRLAAGTGDGMGTVWEAAGGRELLTLRGHTGLVGSVSWSPDGTRLATGSRDGTAKVWEAASSRELLTLRGHTNAVNSVPWSPDGTRLATGSWDGTAKVWDTAGGRELLTLRGHTSWVNSVSWSPVGTQLATGSDDGTARVWDAAGGGEPLTLRGHTRLVGSVSWSPDGSRLATASEDGTAKVWDAAGGRERLTLKGHAGPGGPASWSSDGTRLATGSADCTAKVWDAAGGRELLTLKGHASVILSVSWSPDGMRLATGSWDNTAKVWDAAGVQERLTLKGHTSVVNSVA
jgi:eukaryotic-like serine/threonine-protein kinase